MLKYTFKKCAFF